MCGRDRARLRMVLDMKAESENGTHADQAARLRTLARRRRGGIGSIAITSGKGGVGKTNVAVNLSIALATRGLKVVLIDTDMGLANADLLLNLKPRYTLSHVLAGVRTIEEVCTKGPNGLRFIPGASGLDSLADLSEFERQNLITQFRRLDASADIVILDCGAGLSRNVMSFALACARVMVVTVPEPTALTDAYATVKALVNAGYRQEIGLFVNRAEGRRQAQATHRRVSGVAKRFLDYLVADFGYMLQDTAVELAVREQTPFLVRFPGSSASACITATANAMVRRTVSSPDRVGWLNRVAGLFV